MTKTGERNNQARARHRPSWATRPARRPIASFPGAGEADRYHEVYQHLKALPADRLFPLAGGGDRRRQLAHQARALPAARRPGLHEGILRRPGDLSGRPRPQLRQGSDHRLSGQNGEGAGHTYKADASLLAAVSRNQQDIFYR